MFKTFSLSVGLFEQLGEFKFSLRDTEVFILFITVFLSIGLFKMTVELLELLELLEYDMHKSSLTRIFGLSIFKLLEEFSLHIAGSWTFDSLIILELTHFDFLTLSVFSLSCSTVIL